MESMSISISVYGAKSTVPPRSRITTTPTPPPTTPSPTPITTTTSGSLQCDFEGKCTGFPILTYTFTETKDKCINLCKNGPYSTCNWITYDPESTLCELLEDCSPIFDNLCPTCVSSEVDCEAQPDCYIQGNCQVTFMFSLIFVFFNHLDFRDKSLISFIMFQALDFA